MCWSRPLADASIGAAVSWEAAGHAWGRRAWDWAIYQEPLADNLYEAVLTELDVREGVHLLDIACGSGLAVQPCSAPWPEEPTGQGLTHRRPCWTSRRSACRRQPGCTPA